MTRPYGLQCGAGRADITPPLGTKLYGYPEDRPAETVGDGLTVTAIKLASNTGSALMITCDVASINLELTQRLREMAGKIADVPAENVTVSATHTHSAPNISIKSGWGEVDTEYIESIFIPGVAKATEAAAADCRDATMGIAETDCEVGINRRELREDGKTVLGQNPWGPRDRTMTVISFRDDENKTIANMIHYCCHGTASGSGLEITRDWPGVMTDMLERETGGMTAFYAGVEGDQGPNLPNGKTTGDYQMALQLGAKAGADAVRAYRSIRQWQDAPVRVLRDQIAIPFGPLEPREKAEEELQKLNSAGQTSEEKLRENMNAVIHWTKVLEEYNSGAPLKTHWTFEQSIVTVGPVAWVPCPFEAFVEIGLRIRRGSPYGYTLSLCNTHGCYAYLPTLGEIAREGYEVWHFLLAMRTTYPMPPNTDDYWVQQNLAILRKGAAGN